ncbi:hypothetical protein SK128_016126, partial [Halocaridina rubra]
TLHLSSHMKHLNMQHHHHGARVITFSGTNWTLQNPSQQQEPLLSGDHPTRPFGSVSVDIFQVVGKPFL